MMSNPILLQRHPNSPPSPVEKIEILATHVGNGHLSLIYNLTGDIARLRLPPREEPARRDELWRHTCFEAFVRSPRGENYIEINLSPWGQWAAYRFDGYRSGMMPADVPPPRIVSQRLGRAHGLVAAIDLGALPELAPWETWRCAVAAVIEAEDGSISHWALAHPAGKPDFHDPGSFVLELPPAAGLAHPSDLP
jgi:hypothetical protein